MKFCVIGLGRFGYQVATTLAENGMEVLGVDSNESIIASIRDQITQAICMQVQDEAALRSIGVDEMDTVIVAMGENFAQSILITAILKKHLNIPTVITRGINEVHKEILKLVGADRIVLPEKEIAIKIADKLSAPFADIIRITDTFSLSQLTAPARFVGKAIRDLNLFDLYRIRCIGIKEDDQLIIIGPDYIVKEHDRLVLAGENENLDAIAHL